MIGWGVESTVVLFIAQLMHAVTFGAFHAAGLMAVHRLFGANANSRGQALYSSLGYGAGGGLGAILAGLGWDQVSGEWVFTGASAMAILSLLAIRNAKVL